MKVFLMRHSEPTYADVEERGYTGFGCDLGKLTRRGIGIAEEAATTLITSGAADGIELIVSSPYTRALQTAAIVSRMTGLKIEVETDLHEWIPDMAYQSNGAYAGASWTEYEIKGGVRDAECVYNWEEFEPIRKRALAALAKYRESCGCILAVAHGGVIRAVLNKKMEHVDYCQVFETSI